MATRLGMIAALLFGSGLSALVYQTVWQKLFLFVFGATSDASSAVLGIFLGGLGLGGAVLGKRAEASQRPLYLYGVLELGIGIWAGLSPLVIHLMTDLYAAMGGSLHLGRPLAIVVRLLLASAAIGPAAFLMGGTLPAAARAAVGTHDTARRGLARIYALNTLGAVIGALIGPLYFFTAFGLQCTLYSAVALNLLVGFSAWKLGKLKGKKKKAAREESRSEDSAPIKSSPAPPLGEAPFVDRRVVYVLAGVVGFAFLFMELVWFRMLAPILGGSSITFGLILAVALLGIGAGGFLYSITANSGKKAGLSALTLTLSLEALFLIVPFAWGDELALVTAHLRMMGNLGYEAVIAGWLFVAGVVVFPAALVSGYQFPLIFALLGQGRQGVAREVGYAYAFNTVGTIGGSLLGGFFLLPLWGAVVSWKAATALLLLAAAALVILERGRIFARAHGVIIGLCGALALMLCFTEGPGRIWRHTPIGAGRVPVGDYDQNGLKNWLNLKVGGIHWEQDGREVSVAVDKTDGIAFLVNGKADGAIVGDRGTQIMLGLIPAALHPKAERSFVVGLGTGTTAGMLGLLPEATQVDVAELEPAIKEVAHMAKLANGDVMSNRKVHVLEGDARELLLRKDQGYDLIVSEPSNPYRIGVANLFTREFYELAASRLEENGLFTQWIQGYEIDAYTLSTATRTLGTVFKHVSLWNTQGSDFLLIASQSPQQMNVATLAQRLRQSPFRTWFPRSRFVEGAEAFAAQQLLPPSKIHLLNDAVFGDINTDDLNVMENRFARNLGGGTELKSQLRDLVLGHGIRPDLSGDYSTTAIDDARARLNPTVRWPAQGRAFATVLGCAGKHKEALQHWPTDSPPQDVVEQWVIGYSYASQGDVRAEGLANRLASREFEAESQVIRARLALAHRDPESARRALQAALSSLRKVALPLCDTIDRTLRLSTALSKSDPKTAALLFDELAKAPLAVFARDGKRLETLLTLARIASPQGTLDHKRCTRAYEMLEPYPAWTRENLSERAACYKATRAAAQISAIRDLELFRHRGSRSFVENESQLPRELPH